MSLDYRRIGAEHMLCKVKKTVFVGSGKGGVGKSLVATITSLKLSRLGFKTGLLDLDLHGPAASLILPSKAGYEESREGLKPPVVSGVKVSSISYFLDEAQPIPMRGSDKESTVKEMLSIINWGELDYLIVDLPPGTGGEIAVATRMIKPPKTAILVTQPSKLSVKVMIRAMNYFSKLKIPILGVIINMAGIICGDKLVKPFGRLEVRRELEKYGGKIICEVPIDPEVNYLLEEGKVSKLLDTQFSKALNPLVEIITSKW